LAAQEEKSTKNKTLPYDFSGSRAYMKETEQKAREEGSGR
jgi:hypothetical protein